MAITDPYSPTTGHSRMFILDSGHYWPLCLKCHLVVFARTLWFFTDNDLLWWVDFINHFI